MRANRLAANEKDKDGFAWLSLNACACDPDGNYYYIAYRTPPGDYTNDQVMPQLVYDSNPKNNKAPIPLGIYRVPKAHWNLEAKGWTRIPQTINGGTEEIATKVE